MVDSGIAARVALPYLSALGAHVLGPTIECFGSFTKPQFNSI